MKFMLYVLLKGPQSHKFYEHVKSR